ncbi:MAG: TolC family protein [Gammaproteobacteria bacterium]
MRLCRRSPVPVSARGAAGSGAQGAPGPTPATLEAFPQARAGLLPSVGITANVARNFQQVTVPDVTTPVGDDVFGGGDFTFTSGGYRLNVTQPLYHRDRFIQLKQADSRIRQAQHEVDAVYQELIVRLTERYSQSSARRTTWTSRGPS